MTTFTTREMERHLNIRATTLSMRSESCGLPAHGKPGVARVFSLGDAIRLVVADRLMDRGFNQPTAVGLMLAMAPEFGAIFADENQRCNLVAIRDERASIGYQMHIVRDAEQGLELVFEHPDALIFDIPKLLRSAMIELLESKNKKWGR